MILLDEEKVKKQAVEKTYRLYVASARLACDEMVTVECCVLNPYGSRLPASEYEHLVMIDVRSCNPSVVSLMQLAVTYEIAAC